MRVAGIPLGVGSSSGGMITVYALNFNGADGSTIIDSTGRHTPSLSASGTRAILNNQLNLASGGFIRADAQSTTSTDFDFAGRDFEIECKITYTSGTHAWAHTANDNQYGLCLRFASGTFVEVRSGNNQVMMTYSAPTSFVGRQAKINVSLTGTRYSLKVDDVEVATTSTVYADIGSNGFIIGAIPYASAMTGLIDDFIVRRTF